MSKFFNKHFIHFVLFILESGFKYLDKMFDIYYCFECEKFVLEPKKEGIVDEKS